MLLASGLARFTVELLADHELGCFLTDFLVGPDQTDWWMNLYCYRIIYGARHLDDVTPRRVATVITSQLESWETHRRLFQLDYQPRDPVTLVQDSLSFAQEYAALQKDYLARNPQTMAKSRLQSALDVIRKGHYSLLLRKARRQLLSTIQSIRHRAR
jgi:hypothetical protein